MASVAARSIFRSASVKTAAARGGGAKITRSSFSFPTSRNALSQRILRSPAELSSCVESLHPFHTAIASALMTSMLWLSQRHYGWLSEGI